MFSRDLESRSKAVWTRLRRATAGWRGRQVRAAQVRSYDRRQGNRLFSVRSSYVSTLRLVVMCPYLLNINFDNYKLFE